MFYLNGFGENRFEIFQRWHTYAQYVLSVLCILAFLPDRRDTAGFHQKLLLKCLLAFVCLIRDELQMTSVMQVISMI